MPRPAAAAPLAAILIAALAAPTAAGARSPLEKPAGKPPARQCFWASAVSNFAAADDRTVNLRVGVRDVYQLEMLGPCHDIDWTQRIGIRSRGSDHICSGFDAELITPSTIGPQRCAVRAIRKLTPEEIAALPKRGRP